MKVLVLGAGKMIEGILLGLRESVDLSMWTIYSPSGVSAEKLALKVGAKSCSTFSGLNPDFVLIGCKPQQLKDLKGTIGDVFQDKLFVSILAALSEEQQLKILGAKKLLRFMPNLAVARNAGVGLLSSRSAKDQLSVIENLFLALGKVKVVSEKELDELTLLTGSGPAFFYELAKELASAFSSLTQEEREELARQVMSGASRVAQDSEKGLDTLISEVTSKGGVTIAVLEKWREKNLKGLIAEGIEAGKQRSEELRSRLQS
jgi:pyrroline-5-carboxylate reductase